MAINPRSIAVEGVGFGTRAIAILGFKWFVVDVIPPVIDTSSSGGGIIAPAKLIISIKINGKWKKQEYSISSFYSAFEFVIRQIPTIKFTTTFISSFITRTLAKVSLNTIKSSQPKINVEKKDIEFSVRRKK